MTGKFDKQIQPHIMNFVPQHNGANGMFRLVLDVDGQIVDSVDAHIGFMHRGIEKLIEHKTYTQAIPFFDRLDYLSSMNMEHAFALAVERLLEITAPLRAQYIRVLFSEMSRIINHISCITSFAADIGLETPSLWGAEEREKIMEFFERASGARNNANYIRAGGVSYDLPDGLADDIWNYTERFPVFLNDLDGLLTENRIFKQRTVDIGIILKDETINRGFTGPSLRASGVAWDLRKTQPYEIYNELDFEIPIGTTGDCWARYLVRMEEMKQSCRLMRQCLTKMPDDGRVMIDDNRVAPPKQIESRNSVEECMQRCQLYAEGYSIPSGEIYAAVEAPKGEFGVFLVSDGSNKPYRCRIRSSGFAHMQALDYLSKGHKMADLSAIIGSLDLVMSEIDR